MLIYPWNTFVESCDEHVESVDLDGKSPFFYSCRMIVEYYQEFVPGPKGIKPGRSSVRKINRPEGPVFKIKLEVPDFLFEPLVIDLKIEADYNNMMRDVMQKVIADVSMGQK